MAVTEAQAKVYGYSNGANIPLTLATAPTPGNLLVIVSLGFAAATSAVTGFTQVTYNDSTTTQDAYVYFTRTVQTGDPTAYTLTGLNAYDNGAVLVELAGASGTTTFAGGNSPYNTAATSLASLSIAAPAGSYALTYWSVFTGTNAPTVGADSITGGATRDTSQAANLTASTHSYFVVGHQAFASAGTSLSTAIMPTATAGSGNNTVLTVVAAAAAIVVGNGPVPGGVIGGGGVSGGVLGNNAT